MISLELTIKQHLEAMKHREFDTDGAVSSNLLKLAYEELLRLKEQPPRRDGERNA